MTTYPSPFSAPGVRMIETRLVLSGRPAPSVTLTSSRDVALLVHKLIGDADREHFVVLYLNTRHVVTHAHVVSRGTTQTAPVHPREVFKGALLANAAAIVVAHNHPSGDVTPSPEDRNVTNRLREAGELLGIEMLDSLIVGPVDKFYATAEDAVRSISYDDAREVADGS